jgi:hypothetical protein
MIHPEHLRRYVIGKKGRSAVDYVRCVDDLIPQVARQRV